MKKIVPCIVLVVSCVSSRKQPITDMSNIPRMTCSKETLQKIFFTDVVDVSAPSTVTIMKSFVRHPVGFLGPAYVVFHQTKLGKYWKPVDTLFRNNDTAYFPKIEKVTEIDDKNIVIKGFSAQSVYLCNYYIYYKRRWILQ